MSEVEVIQVIKTMLEKRGDGKEIAIRRIEQYWDMEGNLLFEKDPLEEAIMEKKP